MVNKFIPSSFPYISQAFLVATHQLDSDVRTRIAEAEKCFSAFVSGEAKSTNVDLHTPPQVTRLLIADGSKNLALSQNRIQLEFNFEPDFELEKALKVILNKALPFFEAVSKFQTVDAESMIGFVINLQWPSTQSKMEVSQILASHFYSNKLLGEFDSFEMKLGFRSELHLYKNVGISAYEIREFEMPRPQASRFVNIDIASVPVKEVGIGINLDVNNRLRIGAGRKPEFDYVSSAQAVVEQMKSLVNDEIYDLLPALKDLQK